MIPPTSTTKSSIDSYFIEFPIVPAALPPGTYIGSLITPEREQELKDSKSRRKIAYWTEVSPAYIPAPLWELTRDEIYAKKQLHSKVTTYVICKEITLDLVSQLSPDVQNHVELRLQLFLGSCLLLYKTGLRIILDKARLQIGKFSPLEYASEKRLSPFASAHSSPLPGLFCIDPVSSQKFELAKGSYFEAWQNSTVLVPTFINNPIDTTFDRGTTKLGHAQSLESASVEILNGIASTETRDTPSDAMVNYIKAGIIRLEAMRRVFTAPLEQMAIRDYLVVFESYKKMMGNLFMAKFCSLDKDVVEKEKASAPPVNKCAPGYFSRFVINEAFYFKVRNRMFHQIGFTRNLLSESGQKAKNNRMNAVARNALVCAQEVNVRAFVLDYFKRTTAEVLAKDKAALNALGNSSKKTITKLSAPLQLLYTGCTRLIQETGAKKRGEAAAAPSNVNPTNMIEIVQQIMGFPYTGKLAKCTEGYVALCRSSLAVTEFAKGYFYHVSAVKKEEDRLEIERRKKAKVCGKGKKPNKVQQQARKDYKDENGLPDRLRPLYALCLTAIRQPKVLVPSTTKARTPPHIAATVIQILQSISSDAGLSPAAPAGITMRSGITIPSGSVISPEPIVMKIPVAEASPAAPSDYPSPRAAPLRGIPVLVGYHEQPGQPRMAVFRTPTKPVAAIQNGG